MMEQKTARQKKGRTTNFENVHKMDDNNDSNDCYFVMAEDSRHSFDRSRGTLRVAIDMPEPMKGILRNAAATTILTTRLATNSSPPISGAETRTNRKRRR